MAVHAPLWSLTTSRYTVPVDLSKTMPKRASRPTPELRVSGYELVWSAFLSGRPGHLAPGVLTTAEAAYRHWRVAASLGMVEPDPAQQSGLVRTQYFRDLDPTERGHLNYALGGTMAKAYLGVKLGVPWLAHLSLITNSHTVAFGTSKKRPDYIGLDPHGSFIVAEAKGREVLRKSLKSDLDAKVQTGSVALINSAPPTARFGIATVATRSSIHLYATDPPDEEVRITPGEWLTTYYGFVRAAIESAEQDSAPTTLETSPVSFSLPDNVIEWSHDPSIKTWKSLDRAVRKEHKIVLPDLCVVHRS